MPSVSAIIPNYNHGHLLPQAVAALKAQTQAPAEIIVVDDGSTDDSRAVAGTLGVTLIAHETNRGAVAALNTGIAAASSDYLYLGAADDIAYPPLVAELGGLADRHPGLGLYCAELRQVDGRRTALRPAIRPAQQEAAFTPAQTRALIGAIDNFIMTGAALLDRRKLVAAGRLRPELGSFADGFAVRQLALRHGFAFTPAVLAEWRVSNSGLSRQTASDPASVDALVERVGIAFASDPAFPPGYAETFIRRWRFGVARLALPKGGRLRQLAALAALTLRYRPFALRPLLSTAVRRKLEPPR